LAVAERLAEGCTVLFVDHDAARLSGRVDERWSLAGGRVTVTGVGVGAGGATADAHGPRAAPRASMIIEIAGLEARSLTRLAQLPGVESVLASPAGPGAPQADGGVVEVTVTASRSDDLLRELLTFDGVHVRSVRPGPGTPGPVP
jgi:hypothetical protein